MIKWQGQEERPTEKGLLLKDARLRKGRLQEEGERGDSMAKKRAKRAKRAKKRTTKSKAAIEYFPRGSKAPRVSAEPSTREPRISATPSYKKK